MFWRDTLLEWKKHTLVESSHLRQAHGIQISIIGFLPLREVVKQWNGVLIGRALKGCFVYRLCSVTKGGHAWNWIFENSVSTLPISKCHFEKSVIRWPRLCPTNIEYYQRKTYLSKFTVNHTVAFWCSETTIQSDEWTDERLDDVCKMPYMKFLGNIGSGNRLLPVHIVSCMIKCNLIGNWPCRDKATRNLNLKTQGFLIS